MALVRPFVVTRNFAKSLKEHRNESVYLDRLDGDECASSHDTMQKVLEA